jgi:hypothetical protein
MACGAAALVTTTAANASGDLAVINDEQTAAAGVLTAFHVVDRLSWEMVVLVKLGQLKADRVLQELNSLTTPAALMADPDGIDVACATSGQYHAQLTSSFPRRLNIEWQACVFPSDGFQVHTLNGPARITLLDNSFTAPFVGEIRLGTPSRDLKQDDTTSNYSLRGLIPMQREPFIGQFIGPFGIHIDGFFDEEVLSFDGSGNPLPIGFRLTADSVTTIGSQLTRATPTDTLFDINTEFVGGALTYTYREGDDIRETQYQTFDHLKFRDVSVLGAGRVAFELDGNTEYFYNESAGPRCLSGGYRFKTGSPVRLNLESGDPQGATGGSLRVNGAVLARFSETEPDPESGSESEPRMTMLVGGEVFSHPLLGGNLNSVAQCFP